MKEEQDRWQSLAEELGLPPEPSEPQKTSKPPAAASAPERVVEIPAPPAPVAVERVAAPQPAVRELPPVSRVSARIESTVAAEEPVSLPPITSIDPPHLDPMLERHSPDRLPESEGFSEEPGSGESDRPRGRGRRGQRGSRRGRGGERPESDTREPEAAGETASEGQSRRGGGGRGRRPDPRPEPEPEPEEMLTDEETVDHVEEEDVDDGPEDNLADLNVPSWADLIASLYRPER